MSATAGVHHVHAITFDAIPLPTPEIRALARVDIEVHAHTLASGHASRRVGVACTVAKLGPPCVGLQRRTTQDMLTNCSPWLRHRATFG